MNNYNIKANNISIIQFDSINEFDKWKTKEPTIIHDIKIIPDGDYGEHSFNKIKIYTIYSKITEVKPR